LTSLADLREIEQLKATWLAALRSGDVDSLISMVTDDVVAAHPGGKTTHGKQELAEDFRRFFQAFRMDQSATSEETVIAGEWAFDRARLSTRIVPVAVGECREVNSEVIVILRRDAPVGWKIARMMAVLR
jgi:ketosteroid isomerase-like protein